MHFGRTTRGLMLAGLCLVTGCDSRPQAPELSDSPVYQNDSEGFEFRVPQGWTQTANAILPPGDFEGHTFLVRYLVQSPEGGSVLNVLCFTDQEQMDLQEYHAGPAFGVQQWDVIDESTPVEVAELSGQRMKYSGQLYGKTAHKDVLCVRRGNRVYSFIGIYFDGDDKAMHAIHRALDSLRWDA
jgi:hypothetical protein